MLHPAKESPHELTLIIDHYVFDDCMPNYLIFVLTNYQLSSGIEITILIVIDFISSKLYFGMKSMNFKP